MNPLEEIVVIWKNRPRTLEECTNDWIVFMIKLKQFDHRFDVWYEKGMSRKEALSRQAILDFDYIKNKFCKGCPKGEYPEFMYDISFWNGGKTDNTSYSIRASLGGGKVIGNNLVKLSFPRQGELFEHYSIQDNWSKLRELFIEYWEPDQTRNFDGKLIDLS